MFAVNVEQAAAERRPTQEVKLKHIVLIQFIPTREQSRRVLDLNLTWIWPEWMTDQTQLTLRRSHF